MELKINVKLNSLVTLQVTGEGKNLMEAVRQVNPLLAFNGECGMCKSKDVILQGKTAKTYSFTEFVCNACGARASWGQYKEGGYFLKKWEKYDPNAPKGEGGDVNF